MAIWSYLLRDDLVQALKAEAVEVVALLQGESTVVPSYRLHDLYSGSERLPMVEAPAAPVPLPSDFLRAYAQCIGRLSFIPRTHEYYTYELGAVGSDNLVDFAALHLHACARVLLGHRVEELWFFATPHLGLDQAMEFQARRLGIAVRYFRQGPAAGKFFYSNRAGLSIDALPLPFLPYPHGAQPPNLHYMPGQTPPPRGRWAQWTDRLKVATRSVLTPWRPLPWARLYLATQRRHWSWLLLLLDLACPRNRELAVRRWLRRRRYQRDRRQRRWIEAAQREQPYVYFPLHYEPEASTAALGGAFTNQLDALTALVELLPPGWLIRVKENPAQGYLGRDSSFFARIRLLPGVVFVADEASSADLIAGAQVVATVTGTAGFEALLQGKPCVYFGEAWYQGFPGAFAYQPALDLRHLAGVTVERAGLDAAVNARLSSAADGLVFPRYSALLPPPVDWAGWMQTTARSLAAVSRAYGQTGS